MATPRLRKTSTGLRLTHSLRRLGTRYTLRRTRLRLEKAERRLQLLDQEIRHQLLLTKELEQHQRNLLHRLQEVDSPVSPMPETSQQQTPLWLAPIEPLQKPDWLLQQMLEDTSK